MNPTYGPTRGPTASVQHFPLLTQPLPVGLVTPGTASPSFPAGSLDWLKGFLQSIMSPADFEMYKGRIGPTPRKEEVPLALQLANKTNERGSVLAQIERERVLVSDLKTKYHKHAET